MKTKTTGPNVIRKNMGRMNNARGNINFIGIFWANSSARWNLLVRMKSE
jgi:hypothetical protein